MDRERLEQWLDEGLSLEAIGRRAGRHPSTVSYWIAKHGLRATNRDRHAPQGPIGRGELADLLARGLTTRAIAARLGRSQTNVRYWLKRHGLAAARVHGVPPGTPGAPGDVVDGRCPKHGIAPFVRRRDDAWRCLKCRTEAVTERRRRVKALLVREAGGRCSLCGYDASLSALQFHHRDPRQKRFALAGRGATLAIETLREEAKKCVLLCANCHAEVEAGIANLLNETGAPADQSGVARTNGPG